MAWIEAALTGGKAIAATGTLIKASPWALKHVKRAYWRATKGSVIIPVFGPGGTGKSTVAKILTGSPVLDVIGLYKESLRVEETYLTGDIPGQIRVAPGQLARIDRYWPPLFREISNNKSKGLINVVSYGHHSIEIPSYKEHDLYKKAGGIANFRRIYLQNRRDLEIEFLKKIYSGLYSKQGNFWFLTLVNKQDLWNNQAQTVRAYYENGNYMDVISSIREKIGGNNFQHEFLAGSLCVSNLTDASGEPFVKTISGFDLNIQSNSSALIIDKINGFIEQ